MIGSQHTFSTFTEKLEIIKETGITMKQLTNWFVNNRKRYWRPRVEARLQQQAQAAAVAAHAHAAVAAAVKQVAAAQVPQVQPQPTLQQAPSPVSPEAGFKPTMSVSTPNPTAFVNFMESNASRATAASPVLQMQPTASAATRAVELLLAQAQQQMQQKPTVSLQTPGEAPVQTVAPTVSEGEMSDASSDKDGAVINTSFQQDLINKAASASATYARTVSMGSLDKLDVASLAHEAVKAPTALVTPTKKRSRSAAAALSTVTPQRKKFRRVSIDMWKEACRAALNFQDEGLPSFEEASRLFGYSN